MGKAGLLSRPTRGRVVITAVGGEALASHPAKIDIGFLPWYPDFEAFRTRAKPPIGGDYEPTTSGTTEQQNPRNCSTGPTTPPSIDRGRSSGPTSGAGVSLGGLRALGGRTSWRNGLRELNRSDAATFTKLTGDEGIDGIIDEDKLGLDGLHPGQEVPGQDRVAGRHCRHLGAWFQASSVYSSPPFFTSDAVDHCAEPSDRADRRARASASHV